uniref:ATP-dependent DNA helicase n=1 Tax=Strongyloides stercoralis TaxID=6248 RepID=A0AAF5DM37_STRER
MAYELEKGSETKKLCNIDQLNILDKLLNSILKNNEEKIFFIDGPGGTGKTFLYNCLIHYLMGNNKNVITVAWTGIASILLPNGTTSHRAFKLPLEIDNYSTWCVKSMKDKEYLYKTDVIIWDEASMILGRVVEMVDELLKDLCNSKKPFGGKFVIFGGDFRQVLPVVKYATPAKIINSTLKSTSIWPMCTKLKLTKNMRSTDMEHANWLLNVGYLCDSISLNQDLSDKIIIACHNDDVRALNEKVLNLIEGEAHTYLSIDVAKQRGVDQSDEDIQLEYQVEYLNSLSFNGFPVHKLKLKIGSTVMLLRNLSIKDGLCNGTRLQIVKLYKHLIAGKFITGNKKGEIAFIPRIKLDTGDTSANKLPFVLERRQFPITLAFAITINKSQEQSFNKVGIYVDKLLFSHGQLYVALSRCKKKEGIKIQSNSVIKNVVWKEILNL